MSDPFAKVKSGEKLRISATAYNSFVDAARDFYSRQRDQTAEGRPGARPVTVFVRNDSGADVVRGGVLGVSGVAITPEDNLDEFLARPVLVGVAPDAEDHFTRFVVPAGPIATGAVGFAFAGGVCPAQVDVTDAAHGFAKVADGQTAKLTSDAAKGAAVLWKPAGTGVVWALVYLPAVKIPSVTVLSLSGDRDASGYYSAGIVGGGAEVVKVQLCVFSGVSPGDLSGLTVTAWFQDTTVNVGGTEYPFYKSWDIPSGMVSLVAPPDESEICGG